MKHFEREVDLADALLNGAIGRLSNHCPERIISETALEDLHSMRPHFQCALAALAEIESRRNLTLKEISCRRAFKMLLEGAKAR